MAKVLVKFTGVKATDAYFTARCWPEAPVRGDTFSLVISPGRGLVIPVERRIVRISIELSTSYLKKMNTVFARTEPADFELQDAHIRLIHDGTESPFEAKLKIMREPCNLTIRISPCAPSVRIETIGFEAKATELEDLARNCEQLMSTM